MDIKTISVAALKEKLDQSTPITLIDCRETSEWQRGHLPGAKLIPLGELGERHEEVALEGETVVYCAKGMRSANACLLLTGFGHANAASLEGGILAWIDAGYPLAS